MVMLYQILPDSLINRDDIREWCPGGKDQDREKALICLLMEDAHISQGRLTSANPLSLP